MSTINAIVPVIKHVVNYKNFHFQYHIMKTAKRFIAVAQIGFVTLTN